MPCRTHGFKVTTIEKRELETYTPVNKCFYLEVIHINSSSSHKSLTTISHMTFFNYMSIWETVEVHIYLEQCL